MLGHVTDLAIGELAARAGVSVPTLRYYESRGLIRSVRTAGNQRRFERSMLRRLAVVAAAQRIGLSLDEVGAALASLPGDRTPTRADWTSFASQWRQVVDGRIAELQALREDLDGCVGCGCLSIDRCALVNPGDAAAAEGTGSRWVRAAHRRP